LKLGLRKLLCPSIHNLSPNYKQYLEKEAMSDKISKIDLDLPEFILVERLFWKETR